MSSLDVSRKVFIVGPRSGCINDSGIIDNNSQVFTNLRASLLEKGNSVSNLFQAVHFEPWPENINRELRNLLEAEAVVFTPAAETVDSGMKTWKDSSRASFYAMVAILLDYPFFQAENRNGRFEITPVPLEEIQKGLHDSPTIRIFQESSKFGNHLPHFYHHDDPFHLNPKQNLQEEVAIIPGRRYFATGPMSHIYGSNYATFRAIYDQITAQGGESIDQIKFSNEHFAHIEDHNTREAWILFMKKDLKLFTDAQTVILLPAARLEERFIGTDGKTHRTPYQSRGSVVEMMVGLKTGKDFLQADLIGENIRFMHLSKEEVWQNIVASELMKRFQFTNPNRYQYIPAGPTPVSTVTRTSPSFVQQMVSSYQGGNGLERIKWIH